MAPSVSSSPRRFIWRDARILGWITQLATLLAVAGVLYFLGHNMVTELRIQRGIVFTYSWLDQTAGFDVSESLIPYNRSYTYGRVIVVGLLNTLKVAVFGILLATIIGVFVGITRLSTNFLARRLAAIYVELFRNIPLLILLVFWYQAIFLKLPALKEAIVVREAVFISIRGTVIPWGEPTSSWNTYLAILVFGIVAALAVIFALNQYRQRTGRAPIVTLWSLITFLGIALAGWFILPQPLTLSMPYRDGLRISGGQTFSPEYLALLSGLSLYTSTYVAENVRGAIQAVSKGQYEASSAVGLTRMQAMRLVIMPQAMRILIPPQVSIYLGLIKNSSLAVAVGYPDFFNTTAVTSLNQNGRAIEIYLIVMGVYLLFSLTTSAILNWYNQRIQIVER